MTPSAEERAKRGMDQWHSNCVIDGIKYEISLAYRDGAAAERADILAMLRPIIDRIRPTTGQVYIAKEYAVNDLMRDLRAIADAIEARQQC